MPVGLPLTRSLEDRSALVIGASRGIGEAIVRALAEAGANVTLASRDLTLMREIADDIDPSGKRSAVVRADVTDAASLANAVATAVRTFGKLDIAVNNAGVQIKRAPFVDISQADFEHVVGVNLTGVFLSMQPQLRAMEEGGGGAIVNVSSVGGLVGLPQIGPYIASKHGVIGLTKTAALEYASKAIRVNAIAPGPTMTDLFRIGPGSSPEKLAAMTANVPFGRVAEPAEVAGAAVWLCCDAAAYITGVTLPIDGGYVVP